MIPENVYGYSSMSTEIDPLLRRHDEAASPKQPGTSWIAAGFLLANITIGMGLVNYPKAMRDNGGIVFSLTIEMVCLLMVITCLFLLAYASRQCRAASLQEILKSCFGLYAMRFCGVLIIIQNFGASVVSLIALGDQLGKGMVLIGGPEYCLRWYMNRIFTLSAVCYLFILPICFPKRFDVFKYTSIIGAVAILYMVVLVVVKYIVKRTEGNLPKQGPLYFGSRDWIHTLGFVPTVCFNFESGIEAVLIYNSLKQRTMAYYGKMVFTCLSVCTVVYTAVGVFGYLTFGPETKDDILLSYHSHDIMASVAALMIAIKLITGIPPLLYCVRTALEDLCLDRCFRKHELLRRILLTTLLLSIALGIALVVPEIGKIIALLGGFAAFFIFIFPGLCFIRITMTITPPYNSIFVYLRFFMGIFFTVLGFFVFGYSTVRSAYVYLDDSQATKIVAGQQC